jgi:hypothetical protein
MFTTCLFCHASLGTNEMVEHFPVGRRLAFDGGKGRLWVVCVKCGQWNLAPIEERWEAIEECERSFRETRLRVSTDNIGLARLAEGLTLVRIGRPQRPELAAWRYGDQFGRRRRRYVLLGGAGMLGVAAVFFGGPAVGLIGGGSVTALNYALHGFVHYRRLRSVTVRIPAEGRAPLELAPVHVGRTELVRHESPDGWALSIPHRGPDDRLAYSMYTGLRYLTPSTIELTGPDAVRAARLILPKLNAGGGSRSTVRDAVDLLQDAGGPEACFAAATNRNGATPGWRSTLLNRRPLMQKGDPDALRNLPAPVRLALEMAAHEEIERQALEGELARLEEEWRAAEEIAAIADDLLLPPNVQEFIETHRRGGSG